MGRMFRRNTFFLNKIRSGEILKNLRRYGSGV
jgi:hypothetical protein